MEVRENNKLLKIYGFVGVQGAGKTYNANKLIQEEGFINVSFADCLRNMSWKILSWKPENAEQYDLFKKGLISIPNFGKINGRKFLQVLGDSMRQVDAEFWTKQWKKTVEDYISMGYNNICCDDVRYPNELLALFSYNWKAEVKVEFVDYHSERYECDNKHISEKMSQTLLKMGYKHKDIITKRTITDVMAEMIKEVDKNGSK